MNMYYVPADKYIDSIHYTCTDKKINSKSNKLDYEQALVLH